MYTIWYVWTSVPFWFCISYTWIWVLGKILIWILSQVTHHGAFQEGMNLFLLKMLSWDNFQIIRMEIHLELPRRLIWTQFKNYESLLVTIVFNFKELSRIIIIPCYACVCEYVSMYVCLCVYVKFTCWFILLLNFCIEKLHSFNWQIVKIYQDKALHI